MYSGSVYHDKDLMKVFPGETLPPDAYSSMSVIKTHNARHKAMWQKAIVIIRNFRDCYLSRSIWQKTRNHTATLTGQEKLLNASQFQTRIESFSNKYKNTYMSLIDGYNGSTLVLQYEHMVYDLYPQLVRIRDFLDADASDEDLRCILCFSEGKFHREKSDIDPWKNVPDEVMRVADEADEFVQSLLEKNTRENLLVYRSKNNIASR